MTKLLFSLAALLLVGSLLRCTDENGLPDPPVQQLVPCNPDAGSDDPLACPSTPDAATGTSPPADGGAINMPADLQ